MNFIEFALVIILIAVGCGIFAGSCEKLIHKKQSNISGGRIKNDEPGKLYYADNNTRAGKYDKDGNYIPVYRIKRTKTGCLQCGKCYKFLSKSKIIDHCPHCGCEFDWVDVENFFM